MGGRDHSCPGCGCGGFNDPDGDCECLERCVEALWECMKHAGADTSYADSADHAYRLGHLWESAVEAVKELRQDYIEAGGG